jgi:hypothetical protein
MNRPPELDIHDSTDPIPSSVWRKIVAASSEYELSMERGESIEPTEFALRYQDIPAALLLAELKKFMTILLREWTDPSCSGTNCHRAIDTSNWN